MKNEDQNFIVGLEVGTSKVVVVVGEILPDGVINVIGVGSCPSKGIERGSITDLTAVISSIKRAIEIAESIADCQIISVTLAITGEHIQGLNDEGVAPIANREVTSEEIEAAMHIARSIKLPEGMEVLHVIPQEYAVDKQLNIKNPLGLQGVRLKAQAHLIACHQDWVRNLKKAVESNKLKVDNIIFSGLASSYSVLTEDEKDLGVCLIDIGGGTIDIVVYTNGALRYSKVIRYAGSAVTEDIAYLFTTSRQEAENVKITHGSTLVPPSTNPHKQIEVMSIGGRAPKVLTKEMLSEVISARYKELLLLVKHELDTLKHELNEKRIKSDLIAGIVLTGGGAEIEDVAQFATNIFDSHVRVGYPINITGLTDYVHKPQYATVLGLLQYNYYNSNNKLSDAKNDNSFKIGNIFQKIFHKVKSEF